jgi:hypothetical protein
VRFERKDGVFELLLVVENSDGFTDGAGHVMRSPAFESEKRASE